MSCFVMNSDSIRRIGYTIAEILNACKFSSVYTFDKNAASVANLHKVFEKYESPLSGFDPEAISKNLYMLNVKAYDGRYRKKSEFIFTEPDMKKRYNLRPVASAGNMPQEWHYHLARLIDCYLYQTEEDETNDDPMRKALETFQTHLMHGIVSNSEQYKKFRWGE